jgi:hypothetical protein
MSTAVTTICDGCGKAQGEDDEFTEIVFRHAWRRETFHACSPRCEAKFLLKRAEEVLVPACAGEAS